MLPLLKGLEDLKSQGVEQFDMPRYSRQGLEHKSIPIDEAVATVKRRKWAGIAQTAASTVLMAAGCLTMPSLLVSGIVASTAFGLAAVGAELHAHRHEINDRVAAEIASKRKQVGELVSRVSRTVGDEVRTMLVGKRDDRSGDDPPPPVV